MDKKLIKEKLKGHDTQIRVIFVFMEIETWRKNAFKLIMQEGINLKECEKEWKNSSFEDKYEWISNNFIPAFESNIELQDELFKHITSMVVKINIKLKKDLELSLGL